MPIYQNRLKEQLNQHWSAWLRGWTVTTEANGETLLHGRGRRLGGTARSAR